MIIARCAISLCLCMLVCSDVLAGNKALLIGATSYEQSRFDLSGIDKDLLTMHQFAELLGFENDHIRTVRGIDVNLENLENQFSGFLSDGVGPNDSILIYYSGHGVQIRDENDDEADGRDEALTMHNLAVERRGYSGLLTDDQLQKMLDNIPSKNVMLIVDACHSGTVTRNLTSSVTMTTQAFGDTYEIKALPYRGEPTRSAGNIGKAIEANAEGLIALSAAQDDEQALATTLGSTFTLSLFSALQQHRGNATPETLINISKTLIKEKIDPESLFTPNISGDPALAIRPFKAASAAERGDIYWQQLENLVKKDSTIKLTGISERYVADQEISFDIEIPFDGYLNLVLVDSDDVPIVLFPNTFITDNYLAKGIHTLPASSTYGWYAQQPWGRNMLIAFHSKSKLDLTSNNLNLGTDGKSTVPFIQPSPVDMSRLESQFAQPTPTSQSASAVYFETCPDKQSCWQ